MNATSKLSLRIHEIEASVYPLAAMLSDQPPDHLEGREFHVLSSARRQATELAEKVDGLHDLSERARGEAESEGASPSLPSDLDPEELMRALYRAVSTMALLDDRADCHIPPHKYAEVRETGRELNQLADRIAGHLGLGEDAWEGPHEAVWRRVKKRKSGAQESAEGS